jgi:hypothetical protein
MKVFCELTQEMVSVFSSDDELDVLNAYRLHERLHFLRMLSYNVPHLGTDHALIRGPQDRGELTISDFGCGLAQRSWDLAERLKAEGRLAELILADVPALRKQFLLWLGDKLDIPVSFHDCTSDSPLPDFPAWDVCIATKVLKSLHRPISLSPGSIALLGRMGPPGRLRRSSQLRVFARECRKFSW